MSEKQIVKVTRNSDEEDKIDSISSFIESIENYEPEILILIGSFFEEIIPKFEYALLHLNCKEQLIQIENRRFINNKILYNYHFNWDFPYNRIQFRGATERKNIDILSQDEQYYANIAPFSFNNEIIIDFMAKENRTPNFFEIDYYY